MVSQAGVRRTSSESDARGASEPIEAGTEAPWCVCPHEGGVEAVVARILRRLWHVGVGDASGVVAIVWVVRREELARDEMEVVALEAVIHVAADLLAPR